MVVLYYMRIDRGTFTVSEIGGETADAAVGGTDFWQKGQTLLYKFYCICLTVGCGIW